MTLDIKEDIQPVSDFRKATARFLKRLATSHNPIILTQRGRSVAVIVDVDTYQRLEYESRFRASYFRGVKDLDQGRSISHRSLVKQLKRT